MTIKQPLALVLALSIPACAVEAGNGAVDAEARAQQDSALCSNALSPSQEKTALKLIDDICGDTWCEGDNNFAFDRLSCHAGSPASPNGGSCTLKLRIIPREDEPPSYSRVCSTGGFRGFDSLVQTAQSGYQSLDWDFYLALTECISKLEAELPH
jgi:hypothetical protein